MLYDNLIPNLIVDKIWNINPAFFTENNVKGLLIDVDNTLAYSNSPLPYLNAEKWLSQQKIPYLFVSNNNDTRVGDFARIFNIKYIHSAKKPSRKGLLRGAKLLNLDKKNIAVIGDQIFTDIYGGNRAGMITILVTPFENEKNPFFILKRKFEGICVRKYYKIKEK